LALPPLGGLASEIELEVERIATRPAGALQGLELVLNRLWHALRLQRAAKTGRRLQPGPALHHLELADRMAIAPSIAGYSGRYLAMLAEDGVLKRTATAGSRLPAGEHDTRTSWLKEITENPPSSPS